MLESVVKSVSSCSKLFQGVVRPLQSLVSLECFEIYNGTSLRLELLAGLKRQWSVIVVDAPYNAASSLKV